MSVSRQSVLQEAAMPFSVAGYEDRAQECVKLANQAKDQMVRSELLTLRQTYLNIAGRLRGLGLDTEYPRKTADSREG